MLKNGNKLHGALTLNSISLKKKISINFEDLIELTNYFHKQIVTNGN